MKKWGEDSKDNKSTLLGPERDDWYETVGGVTQDSESTFLEPQWSDWYEKVGGGWWGILLE